MVSIVYSTLARLSFLPLDIPDSPKQSAAHVNGKVKHLNEEQIFLDSFIVEMGRCGKKTSLFSDTVKSYRCLQLKQAPNGFGNNLLRTTNTFYLAATWTA